MRTLITTTPPMGGQDVLAVQRDLKILGYKPGAINGLYGAVTHSEVVQFQRDHKLAVDGVVGPSTWAALNKIKIPDPVHPGKPTPVVNQGLGYQFIEAAIPNIGYKESPANSNNTKFGAEMGVNYQPWCNSFVSSITKSCGAVLCKGYSGPGVVANGCVYVPTTEAWFKSKEIWHTPGSWMQDGDIICFNWDGGAPDHIGFAVTENTLNLLAPSAFMAALNAYGHLSAGYFWTIEGNTSVGNDSNGGEVMIRQRPFTEMDGFGRITA